LPYQLRRTVFDPRNNALTDAQRQEQLNSVAINGHAGSTYNSSNATTTVVFENLFNWTLTPRGATYDGYASATGREANVLLGSVVLDTGPHAFKFEVTGKSTNSSGYKLGVDSLFVSPSYSVREGEAQLPATTQLGGFVQRQLMQGGSWSGNYELYFPGTRVGDYFTLSLENDRWEETNFATPGDQHASTTVQFDTTLDPADFVVTLDGMNTNWSAWLQSGDAAGTSACPVSVRSAAVRVLLRGEDMVAGNWISRSGARSRVAFSAGGTQTVSIAGASIATAASTTDTTMDCVTGTAKRLRFGGSDTVSVAPGATVWSDWTDLAVESRRSYLVTYLLGNAAHTTMRYWRDAANPTLASSFAILTNASASDIDRAAWSGTTNVVSVNGVIGVEHLYGSYPTQGCYESAVFDTHCDAPVYREINVDAAIAQGSDLDVKVRTGTVSDMSDAPAWTNVTPIPTYGVVDPGTGRYVQFEVAMAADTTATLGPKLKSVTIRWNGPKRVVEVGGTFAKGPDHGTYRLSVDGRDILTGVSVDLQIFKYVRGHRSSQMVCSRATAEVKPLNTGL
jgi:hypothetical protein